MIFIDTAGRESSAGAVLGSDVPIVCRMNAPVLRGDTVRWELRDAESRIVAEAELPDA